MSQFNKDQIDAYSRYMHGLSLAGTISLVSLPYSDEIEPILGLKTVMLLALTILLFWIGTYILRTK